MKKILKPPPGQATELCTLLLKTIDAYAHEQKAAGNMLLMNDILSALAGGLGTMLAGVPEEMRNRLFGDVGVMVKMSIDMSLERGAQPQVELVQSTEEGTGTMQ